MLRFSDYEQLDEASKNLHLTHIEETIITEGSEGANNALGFLKGVRDMLSGSTRSSVNITTKWDGAPAIFCGIDPADKKFFVATKSVFNKNPKLNKTTADIRKNHSGGLVSKLDVCLKELPKLGIKGVLQGDLMFTKGDLKTTNIEGVSHYTFQPNTIVYAVPKDDPFGKFINKVNLGIIFHTEYKGAKLEDMKASFNINIKKLRKSNSIWFDDASYKDVSGMITLTKDETTKLDKMIDNVESQVGKLSSFLDKMSEDFDEKNRFAIPTNFKVHLNSYFKGSDELKDASKTIDDFVTFWENKMDKEVDSKKTDAAKDKYRAMKEDGLKKIESTKTKLVQTVDMYINIMDAKDLLVKKLSKVKSIGTFLQTNDGLKTTAPEGFVAVDRVKGNAVKLVNRLEFSRANFTATKNWVNG